jgi:hypothetical protein
MQKYNFITAMTTPSMSLAESKDVDESGILG